jgi:hypothetical protein
MNQIESLIFLLGAAALLAQLARVLKAPYPVFLVLGGLVIGFVPGLPTVELSSEVIFLVFLPLLLNSAAFFSSPRDLRRQAGDEREYDLKEREQREENRIPAEEPILFLEVDVDDHSEFANVLEVRGVEVGDHRVLCIKSSTVSNAIAAFLLHLRDTSSKKPHCYFGWTEGNPIVYLFS